ncbi:MAG: hypothetical protein KGP28_12075 [Bdellovibrionales bacterium]|nr:hypothetical protein [Bdellovibrionales bacterium]
MKKLFTVPAMIFGALMLANCGSNDVSCPQGQIAQNGTCVMNGAGFGYGNGYNGYNNGYNNGYGQTGYNNCQNGTFPTQYGCLQRGNCPQNQAFYPQNNQCVPVTNTYGNGTNGGFPNNGYQNQCPNGMVPTFLGCLNQGNCPQGWAYSPQYNTCVAAQFGFGTGFSYGMSFGVGATYGGCMNGYANTSNGCLPQANCPFGMGLFNGYCVH